MATYEKMVLITEAEYMNLKNYKYLPHEIEGDEESGYDDDNDESGYRPGRIRRQPQTPDDRHIQTPRPSPTSARRSIDLTSSDTRSSASSARSSMSSGDARARAEAAQRIEKLRKAEETAQRIEEQ